MTPRSEVNRFAEIMERKLAENDHKGGSAAWRQETYTYLIDRLRGEADELEWAVQDFYEEDASKIEREAADVANFAMMIADKARNG